jgi:hypothetical protein
VGGERGGVGGSRRRGFAAGDSGGTGAAVDGDAWRSMDRMGLRDVSVPLRPGTHHKDHIRVTFCELQNCIY